MRSDFQSKITNRKSWLLGYIKIPAEVQYMWEYYLFQISKEVQYKHWVLKSTNKRGFKAHFTFYMKWEDIWMKVSFFRLHIVRVEEETVLLKVLKPLDGSVRSCQLSIRKYSKKNTMRTFIFFIFNILLLFIVIFYKYHIPIVLKCNIKGTSKWGTTLQFYCLPLWSFVNIFGARFKYRVKLRH